MTSQTADRRRVARIAVPQQLRGPGLERLRGCLLDLSATGAQIEHTEPVSEGLVCEVDFPPALGRGRLKGKVVWTKVHKRVQTFEGGTRVSYQTGLAFVDITPEQQEVLAAALRILETGELPDGT